MTIKFFSNRNPSLGNYRKNKKRRIVFVAGGSGGHVFPATALAEKFPHADLILLTDFRGKQFTHSSVFSKYISFSNARDGTKVSRLWSMASIALGSLFFFLCHRPDVVWGFGGRITFFPLLWARCLGIKVCGVFQPDRVLGQANRWLSRFVSHVCVTFPDTEKVPSHLTPKIVTPLVRKAFHNLPPYLAPNPHEPFNLSVLGGSQGAAFWIHVVPKALELLTPEEQQSIHLIHQAPLSQKSCLEAAYGRLNLGSFRVVSFIQDMETLFSKTHLFLTRAGASTLAEMLVSHRPGLLVPYPYATDNHQLKNATYLADFKASWVESQQHLTPQRLVKFLHNILHNPKQLAYASSQMALLHETHPGIPMEDFFKQFLEQ